MPISLHIEASNVEEFDTLIARFAPQGAVMPEIARGSTASAAAAAVETPTKSRGRAAKKTDEPAAEVAETPAAGNGETAIEEAGNAGTQAAENADTASVAAGATTAASAGGDVSMQQLKDAMSALIKSKSAAVAMQTLANATGCKSLTSGSPSVAEKVAEDPGIMQRALDALLEAAK